MSADIGIVVMLVACDLAAKVGGQDKLLVHIVELNLGEHKAFIFATKFIYFHHMLAIAYEVTSLLYALATECK